MQRYEYMIQLQTYDPTVGMGGVDQDIHTLNIWGDRGWELVCV